MGVVEDSANSSALPAFATDTTDQNRRMCFLWTFGCLWWQRGGPVVDSLTENACHGSVRGCRSCASWAVVVWTRIISSQRPRFAFRYSYRAGVHHPQLRSQDPPVCLRISRRIGWLADGGSFRRCRRCSMLPEYYRPSVSAILCFLDHLRLPPPS